MIDKFLDYISVEKRYSQNTLVSYKKDLEDLLLFISETEGTEDLKKVDKKIIRNFSNRNVVNIQFVPLNEKKQQIEGTFKLRYFNVISCVHIGKSMSQVRCRILPTCR